MGTVESGVYQAVRAFADGEIGKEEFQERINDIDAYVDGGNWFTISLAVSKILDNPYYQEDIEFQVKKAVIELYPIDDMKTAFAHETVEEALRD